MPVPHKRLTNQLNVCIAVGLAKGDTERFFHLLQEASTRKMGEWGMNSIKPCVSECLAQSNPTRMTQKGSSMVWEPHWVGLLATWFLSYSDRKENQSNFVWWMKLPCLYRVAMLTNSVSFSTDFQLSYFTKRHCQHVLCACACVCVSAAIPHAHVERQVSKRRASGQCEIWNEETTRQKRGGKNVLILDSYIKCLMEM